LLWTLFPEYLSENRRVAGILNLKFNGVTDVIEKGFEAGVWRFKGKWTDLVNK
jgi:hypothetical protein